MNDLSTNLRIMELGDEIEQSPGFKLQQDFFGLDVTRYIFEKNFADLSRAIDFVTTDPRGAALIAVKNRKKLEAFGIEIIRLIYNYTASAVSLVQHTMRLHESLYGKNTLFPEYHDKAKKDFGIPLLTFIQDFRNYCQHIKSPIITFITTGDSNGRLVTKVCIPLTDLQDYMDWKEPAKRFLATIQESLDVMAVLADFHNKEIAFQNWFRTRQEEIHADELKELDDKKDELRELMGDSYIPPA